MWPTFYIPGLALGAGNEFVDPDVGHSCGTWSFANTGTVTIPTPTGATDGDTQIIVLNYRGSSGASFPAPTVDGSPWWLVSRYDGYYDYGASGYQYILWRQYDSADGDFQFDNGSGATKGCYTSILLKNQNTADPVFNVMHMPRLGEAVFGPWDTGPITGLECAESGDLAVFAALPSDAQRSDSVGPSDAEFFCNLYMSDGSTPHISSLVSGSAVYKSRQNNLLKNSTDFSTSGAWTATRCTVTNPSAGTYDISPAVIDSDGTNTTHYIEQSVTLEGGKDYLLAIALVQYISLSTSESGRIWMTVLDSSNNEAGIGCLRSINEVPPLVSTNATSILPNDNVSRGVFYASSLSSLRDAGGFGFYIRPTTTDTYRVRLYLSRFDTDPTVAGSIPSCGVTLSGITLMECGDYNTQPSFIETGSSAVSVGSARGIVPSLPRRSTSLSANESTGYTLPLLRRAGGARPECKLLAPYAKVIGFGITDTTVSSLLLRHAGGQWVFAVGSAPVYIGISATHCVYSLLSQKKFYYEMEPTAFGSSGALDEYAIGFAPPTVIQHRPGVIKPHTSVTGRFAYCADGKIYEDGVNTATVSAWSVNDKIGAAIDFTNAEIKYYRNGTLVHTSDISASNYLYGVWSVHCSINGATASDEAATFAWNFKGPFGGRKPSGFYAYDFDNEVT